MYNYGGNEPESNTQDTECHRSFPMGTSTTLGDITPGPDRATAQWVDVFYE